MKRRNLLRLIADAAHVRRLAWTLVRQGGDHEVGALDGKRITIPRHREINDQTARAILTAFEEVLGRRWWER